MIHQAKATVRLFGVFLAAVLMTASGCTICPSPYDYSGPVPNGSVTQNDFCARSGGTRPLRAAPLVWPQVVQSEETPGGAPGNMLEPGGPENGDDSVLIASTAQDDSGDVTSSGSVIATSAEIEVEQEQQLWRRPAK